MFTRAATRGERYQSALASSQVEESLRSIQVVKAHGYEQQEQQRYNSQLQKLVQLAYLKLVGYTVRSIHPQPSLDTVLLLMQYAESVLEM
jgi:ABC-type multidrug transport system fused ATPase/permease subunit